MRHNHIVTSSEGIPRPKKPSVIQYLFEKYEIEYKPGQKGECPFCGKNTLWVNGDDSYAKCWHPDCGRHVSSYEGLNIFEKRFQDILQESLYRPFHRELMRQKDAQVPNAYQYCHTKRAIHARVIENAMVGAVPQDYQSGNELQVLSSDIQNEINALLKAKGSFHRIEKLVKLRKRVEETQENIIKISEKVGWLCFFYTNANFNITSVRLREPFTKSIRLYKFSDRIGVFGHELFSQTSTKAEAATANLKVVEGEFNLLQLQSLSVRKAEEAKTPVRYQLACAIGGVLNADYITVRKINSTPTIIYDNDEDGGGLSLVTNAREYMNITACTTLGIDSDLDSFIRGHSTSELAWVAVNQILDGKKFYSKHYSAVAKEIIEVRQLKGIKEFEIDQECALILCTDISERALLYHDGTDAYYFLKEEKELIKLCTQDDVCIKNLARFELNRTERIFGYLAEALRIKAFKEGRSR